jgi:VCBS repeat-containing protein
MFLKKGFLFITALALLAFAGQATAGPNAGAVLSLDYITDGGAGNGTDDGVTSGTVAGSGTTIAFEVFGTGVTTSLAGFVIKFTFDSSVLTYVKAENSAFAFTIPEATGTNFASISAVALSSVGFLVRAEFTTAADVTGTEFSVGIEHVVLSETTTSIDTITTTNVISFNAQPKAVPSVSAPVTIPRGENASATVTANGFAADATITFTVDVVGSATVEQSQDGATLTLTASGSGSAVVTVTASDGTTPTAAVTVQFDEQVPVALSAFAGEAVEDHVVLNWATASQTNNAGFRVLRSTDQENYQVVSDLIAGAGTTDALVDYTFTDEIIPAAERVYYVLEQIDLDGTIHRSNPIEVLLGARFLNLPTEFASTVYPNPFNPSTTISYDLPIEADVSIIIYDAIGQEIRQLVSQQHTAGRYSIQWDAKDQLGRSVGSGVYIAKILAGQNSTTQKMLLLK